MQNDFIRTANMLPHVQGVILAGGKSSRMGYDKASIHLDPTSSRTLLQQVIQCAEKTLGHVAISGRKEKGYQSILDVEQGCGPLSGIVSALEAFPDQAIFVLSCDLPFLTEETINNLLSFREKQPNGTLVTAYCQQEKEKIESLIAIYEPEALPLLKRALREKRYKLQTTLPKKSQHLFMYGAQNNLPFFNINYPEDVARAKATLLRLKILE